jgi:hypothetical protein
MSPRRCIPLVFIAGLVAAPGLGVASKVVYVECNKAGLPAKVQPRTVVLACGDGNAALSGLKWLGWGRAAATASGLAQLNDCKPSCVGGTFRAYPVKVTFDRIRPCAGLRQYTRLKLVYKGKPFPPGPRRSVVDGRGCAHPA